MSNGRPWLNDEGAKKAHATSMQSATSREIAGPMETERAVILWLKWAVGSGRLSINQARKMLSELEASDNRPCTVTATTMDYPESIAHARERIVALEAEIARLRAALEKVAGAPMVDGQDIAREALRVGR
jgi:hypothetical protein